MENHTTLAEYLESKGIKSVEDLDAILEPNYFVVIPLEILERTDLSPTAKIVYGEIVALSRKSGKCFATNEYITERLAIGERTVTRSVAELKKKGLIEVDLQQTKKGTYRHIYVNYYKATSQNGEGGQPKRRQGVAKMATQKRNRHIEIDKENLAAQDAAGDGILINDLLEGFKEVNPSYSRLYANKTQRTALSRLIKQHGAERVRAMIAYLPQSNAARYAPTITTPYDLEANLGKLAAWAQKQKAPREGKGLLL